MRRPGLLAYGTLAPQHAGAFRACLEVTRHAYDLDTIIKGDMRWPDAANTRSWCRRALRLPFVAKGPVSRVRVTTVAPQAPLRWQPP